MKPSPYQEPRDSPRAICGYQYPIKIYEIPINEMTILPVATAVVKALDCANDYLISR